jgi:hypothetical protein
MQEWFIGLGLSPANGFELENLNAMPCGEFLCAFFHLSLVSLHQFGISEVVSTAAVEGGTPGALSCESSILV